MEATSEGGRVGNTKVGTRSIDPGSRVATRPRQTVISLVERFPNIQGLD